MPETLLRVDDPKVMVERYGDSAEECLFTVRNETDKPVDAVLRPSAALSSVTGLKPLWRGGNEVPLTDGMFRVRLAPWSSEVFLASTRPASAAVEIREGTIDLPSYAISAPEKSPVFEGNRYGTTGDAKNAAAAYTRGRGHLFEDVCLQSERPSRVSGGEGHP